MKRIFAAAAIVTFSASLGNAQASDSFVRFNESQLREIAASLSHDLHNMQRTDEGFFAEVRTPGGLNYFLIASVCNDQGCQGLHTVVSFVNEIGLTAADTNRINMERASVKAAVDGDLVHFTRYDITDAGATVASLAASVNLTISTAEIITSDFASD